jgi:hypothetical protein
MDLTAGPDLSGLIDATELHRYAEALLTHLATDRTPPRPQPGVTDVPGYWLAPAIDALILIMSGKDALEPLTRAARHDEKRTALFLSLALAISGQGDRVHASWLGTAFGDLSADRPVTAGQRALWLAAARGAYGPAGKIFVLRKLDAVAVPSESEPERWLKALLPGEPAVVVPQSLVDYPELAEIPALGGPAQAAARLARLRGRCIEITSPRKPADPATAAANSGPPRLTEADSECLAVLHDLINPCAQESPLTSLTGHLLNDVQPGADPQLAALALHVAAPVIKSAAQSLAQATQGMPPTEVTVRILGHPIKLRPEGPDTESMAVAEQRIAAECVSSRPGPLLAYALISVGVVVLGASLFTFILLGVLGVALGATGGYLLWQRHVQAQTDATRVAGQLYELKELADRAVWALHDYARETPRRAAAASKDLAELNRLLRRGPRAA